MKAMMHKHFLFFASNGSHAQVTSMRSCIKQTLLSVGHQSRICLYHQVPAEPEQPESKRVQPHPHLSRHFLCGGEL